MRTLKGEFNLKTQGRDEPVGYHFPKDAISCGDYQTWHIQIFRDAIRKRYGYAAAGEMIEAPNGDLSFEYDDAVISWEIIGNDVGVVNSGPSESSSSSQPKPMRQWRRSDVQHSLRPKNNRR